MNQLATVTRIAVKNVHNDILIFLSRYKDKTSREYIRDVEQYFMFMLGKSLEQLTKDDIEYVNVSGEKEKLMSKHIQEYKTHLKNKQVKDTTVIRKIISVRSLYKFLSANGYDVNCAVFDVHGLSTNVDSYDVLSKEQVDQIAQFTLEEEYHAEELHVFVYVASQTSLRVEALLSVKWDDISYDEQSKYHVIETIDKGEQQRKVPVDGWLFEKMVNLRAKLGDKKLFPNLKQDYINKKIQGIAYDKMGISKKKRIVTHSLRKCAPAEEMRTTGNVKLGVMQTGHRSIETFMRSYTDKSVDYNQLAGIRMFKQVDEKVTDLLDKKEILELLKQSNPSAYHQLLLSIQKIIE